jgi:hypothetical protein
MGSGENGLQIVDLGINGALCVPVHKEARVICAIDPASNGVRCPIPFRLGDFA